VTARVTDRAPIRVRVAGSVRFRLTVTVVLVVGLSLLGGGALLVKWVEATLVNDLRQRNEQVLATIAEHLRAGRSIPPELQFSEDPSDGSDDAGVFGQPANDQTMISSTEFYVETQGFEHLKVKGINELGRLVVAPRTGPPLPDSDKAIAVSREVSTRWGVLQLHAVAPVTEIERSVGTLTGALWLGLPVLAIGAGIMTWLITGQALAPVAIMTRRVRELSATTLDARVPVPPTDDEIAQLASTMNEMLDRLQKASLLQRQFVSDASHELRSPVASIRAQLETALRYPDDVDWPAVARIVLEEDNRLEHLVGNLLAMARVEEGRMGPRSEVDLDDLVLSSTPRMTGVALDLSGVSAGRVWGNADELTSVVRNLLDNAARHAGSTVWVSVREAGPWVVLSVADDGPGVAPGDREKVFERFARLQEGRSRDQGGTGLGLALSRRIVEHHGGRIHVEEAPAGGANFVVSLPAAGWTGRTDDPDTDDPDTDDPDTEASDPVEDGTTDRPDSAG
jgi:signal transduction histidine kinase